MNDYETSSDNCADVSWHNASVNMCKHNYISSRENKVNPSIYVMDIQVTFPKMFQIKQQWIWHKIFSCKYGPLVWKTFKALSWKIFATFATQFIKKLLNM